MGFRVLCLLCPGFPQGFLQAALGFHRYLSLWFDVFVVLLWVSTGMSSLRVYFDLCYRFACDIPRDLLYRPLCVASRNGRCQCGCGSVGFPVDVLQVSIGFPASFLRVSSGMLLGFLQVSCGFPVGLLLFPQMGSH